MTISITFGNDESGLLEAAVDMTFGLNGFSGLDFSSIGGSPLSFTLSHLTEINYKFGPLPNGQLGSNVWGEAFFSTVSKITISERFTSDTALDHDDLIALVLHETLHVDTRVDGIVDGIVDTFDFSILGIFNLTGVFETSDKQIVRDIVEELVLRTAIEEIAQTNDFFDAPDSNLPSIRGVIEQYATRYDQSSLTGHSGLTDDEIDFLVDYFENNPISVINPNTLSETSSGTAQSLIDFLSEYSNLSPGDSISNPDGSVSVWADHTGTAGFTDPDSYYTDAFLDGYGTVSDNQASVSFGGHLRGFADMIGLDGQFGIQGSFSRDGEGSDGSAKPVILDLDGDGVEVQGGNNVITNFDYDGDGFGEQTSWVSPDDGFLVIDLNADGTRGEGDGQIDQAREIAFSLWGEEGMTDLQALAQATDANGDLIFDSNSDGVLNSLDDVWDELRIWQDANSNGVVDDGELMTLDEVEILQRNEEGVVTGTLTGITEIDLIYDDESDYSETSDDITVFGNTLHGLASFTAGDGVVVTGGVGDVSLSYAELGWRRVETDIGYSIEFENGEAYHYAVMDGTGSTDVNLSTEWLDGATGDARNNVLHAFGMTHSVALSGLGGDDILTGSDTDDMLSGDAGADVLHGHGGNDLLFVDAADTGVYGGDGHDTVIAVDYDEDNPEGIALNLAASSIEVAYGNSGDDTLNAASSMVDVALYGGGGDDSLTGSTASDVISGDDGEDSIYGAHGDDFITGGAGNDNLNGGHGDDFITGGDGNDRIQADNGDDFILAGDGDDTAWGWNGDDFVSGGDGNDTLYGGAGDDSVFGGAGDDILVGGDGDDRLEGGDGDDTFIVHGSGTTETYTEILGGEGNDVLRLTGTDVSGWTWTSIFEWVSVQIGTIESGPNTGNPIYEMQERARGQYLVTNGIQTIVVQDIEAISFDDGTVVNLAGDATQDNGDTFVRNNFGPSAINAYELLSVQATGGDDTVQSVETIIGQGQDEGTTFTYYHMVGDDTLSGLAGNDHLNGGTGSDSVSGGSGSDNLNGEAGDDTLTGGSGSDVMTGGDGDDHITGNSGSDRIAGGTGDDNIWGNEGADILTGGDGNDRIIGGDGSDIMGGEVGNDTLYGQRGDDRLYGGDGVDTLYGEWGDDRLYGGAGQNHLYGGYGDDLLVGGENSNLVQGGEGFDLIYGLEGEDHLYGGGNDDVIYGGEDTDTLYGESGNDYLEGGAGADIIDGGSGLLDTVAYTSSDAAVTVNLATGVGTGGHAQGDTIVHIENILGSRFDDNLTGSAGHNTLSGSYGNDTLDAGAGNDYLYGGSGQDSLSGGNGIDRLYGGSDQDILVGGSGNDQLFGGSDSERSTALLNITNGSFGAVTLATGVYGAITGWTVTGTAQAYNPTVANLTTGTPSLGDPNLVQIAPDGSIEQLISAGLSEDERFTIGIDIGNYVTWENVTWHDEVGYTIELLIGGEVVQTQSRLGGFENDQFETAYISLDGISLTDEQLSQPITLRITAPPGHNLVVDNVRQIFDHDVLDGGAGDDELFGGDGDDILLGGSGSDILEGGQGNDTLTGGSEADTFVFSDGFGNDVITDFDVLSSLERLDLSGLTEITDFADLTDNHISQIGADTVIDDGDGNTITLTGVTASSLTLDEFVFV